MDRTLPASTWRLGYRPALDGLRGIAVLLVLLSHAGVPFLPFGGQAGVTLFFVLSGFLITSLLLDERAATGRIALGAFYLRRVRRLVPALVLVVVVIAILVPSDAVFRSAVAVSYLSNWVQAAGADISPLNHTWTLAIEEQFYLVWPAILIAGAAARPRLALRLLVVAIAAVAVWRVYLSTGYDVRVLMGTDIRVDGLLLGAAMAFALHLGWSWRPGRAAAVTGLATLAISCTLFPVNGVGLAIGVPLALFGSALLLLVALRPVDALTRPWLGYVGRISYGLYLWHYALLWAFHPTFMAMPWPVRLGALLLVSVPMSAASYELLERRFLRRRSADSTTSVGRAEGVTARPLRTG